MGGFVVTFLSHIGFGPEGFVGAEVVHKAETRTVVPLGDIRLD